MYLIEVYLMTSRGSGYRIECFSAEACLLQSCSPEVVYGTTTATKGKDNVTEEAGCKVAYSIVNHNFLIVDCWASKFLKLYMQP